MDLVIHTFEEYDILVEFVGGVQGYKSVLEFGAQSFV